MGKLEKGECLAKYSICLQICQKQSNSLTPRIPRPNIWLTWTLAPPNIATLCTKFVLQTHHKRPYIYTCVSEFQLPVLSPLET